MQTAHVLGITLFLVAIAPQSLDVFHFQAEEGCSLCLWKWRSEEQMDEAAEAIGLAGFGGLKAQQGNENQANVTHITDGRILKVNSFIALTSTQPCKTCSDPEAGL